MHIGLVGLGKMGANMRTRIRAAGIDVTGYDRNPDVTDVPSLEALVEALPAGERVVWVMVPSGEITDAVVTELAGLLTAGDVLIDGGNSYYQDDQKHADVLADDGCRLPGRRCLGRRLGSRERLRAHGRRRRGRRRQGHAGVRRAASGGPARRGLRARRDGRRRALRQDGAQRHRVRAHAVLRRGLRAAGRERPGHRRARHDARVAAGHRRAVLAAGAAGQGARAGPGPGRDRRLGRGLRRGPLDRRRGDRPGGAGTGDLGVAVRAVPVAPGGVAGDEGRRRAAPAVRWATR